MKARGDIEEIVDSNSDEDNPKAVPPSLKEMIAACQMLEENGLLVCNDVLDTVGGSVPIPRPPAEAE